MNLLRLLTAATVVLLGAYTTTASAAYFDGFFAMDTGDYEGAYNEWRATASTGDAKSMAGLGLLYEDGLGVPQDDIMAHAYYQLATLLGDTQASDKRNQLERRMSAADKQASDDVITTVKQTGKLPPKIRAGSGAVAMEPEPEPEPEVQYAGNGEPGIEIGRTCKFTLSWEDRGSGGDRDVGLHKPVTPRGFWFVGGYVQTNYRSAKKCVTILRALDPGLIRRPAGWELVWADKGSGARMDGSIWRPVAPSTDYACLGSVAQTGYQRPNARRYGCVHRCMVSSRSLGRSLWDDRGTGADNQVTIHRLPTSKAMIAFPSRSAPERVLDLNMKASCVTGQ
mgnify:FL=1